MSNKALIEDLRGWAWQELAATTYGDGILNRAADTIEQLESERDDLDERLNERYSRCNSLEADNKQLREALTTIKDVCTKPTYRGKRYWEIAAEALKDE